jgi:SpoVK/Ycf46/Vps4 family AAA+-type ATPase
MDETEEVPRPDAQGLEQIFQIHFGKLGNKSNRAILGENVDLAFLSQRAHQQGLSGRDVADVIGILARLRGQEQLNRMQNAIQSGRINLTSDMSEKQIISGIVKRISSGDIFEIEDLVLGPITQDEIMYVVDNSKSLLKSKKN